MELHSIKNPDTEYRNKLVDKYVKLAASSQITQEILVVYKP